MARKKKIKSTFHERFPEEYENLKAGDKVVYKRMSDDSISVGIIKYFYVNSDNPSATLIDLLLGNFQTSFVSDIGLDISAKKKKALEDKVSVKPRRSSK